MLTPIFKPIEQLAFYLPIILDDEGFLTGYNFTSLLTIEYLDA